MNTFPSSWWRSDRPLVFGHRGASKVAPENTFAAFSAAAEAGADGIELDVHLSADGILVVSHNARVDKTTDGAGYINDLPLAELRSLDAGSHFGSEFAGERLPILEEVLDTFCGKLLVDIELKPQVRPGPDLAERVSEVLARLGVEDRVWVSSFKPYYLHRMRHVAPSIPCGLLFSPLNIGTLWLVPFTPFEAVHPQFTMVSRWFVKLMHSLRRKVITWTVDDVDRARGLARAGVDGIISDDPGGMLEALRGDSGDAEEGHRDALGSSSARRAIDVGCCQFVVGHEAL